MKIAIPVLLFLFVFSSSSAQSYHTVKGIIEDPTSDSRLAKASICVLNEKDSILYKYTLSNPLGEFAIGKVTKGNYLLLISYPDFADYTHRFTVDTNLIVDFGKINLIRKSVLLNEVIISVRKAAIKIKGDTTEYNASSFIIQPNDKVEDLLVQFPGIQVDNNGRITTQGKIVNKVLVDGAEFFSDDPTLVTRNIRADMVDKVQVYDKKSDQAQLTGVDDGQNSKTLNVVLKEDKKHGHFGEAMGGIGSRDYYQTQFMFNSFKDNYKWSTYGVMANTGKIGLEGFDTDNYGILTHTNDLDRFDGSYYGVGIPAVKDVGIHYDQKWSNDRQNININYKIGSLGIDGSRNSFIQNNLPTGIINTNNDQTFDNYIFRQKFDGIYEFKFDKTSALKITLDAMLKNNKSQDDYVASGLRDNNMLIYKSRRNVSSEVDAKIFRLTALWTKQLNKKGRTLSVSLGETNNQNDAEGYLISKINLYDSSGSLDDTENINQFKINAVKTNALNGNITYSEPLTSRLKLVFKYNIDNDYLNSDRRSYNQSIQSNYDILDNVYSNHYEVAQFSNEGGFILNYKNKKTVLDLHANLKATEYRQLDEFTNDRFKRTFLNLNPEVSYTYTTSQYRFLKLKYSGKAVQPTVDQLQPIRINIDPLNLIIGNPLIIPAYSNQFDLMFTDYKVLNDRLFSVVGTYTMTNNPMTTNVMADENGKSSYQFVNFTDQTAIKYNVSSSFAQKIKSIGTIVGIMLSANGSRLYNYINNQVNKITSDAYQATATISKGVFKKFDINGSFGPNYNINKSSIQSIDNNGFGFSGNFTTNLFLPGNFKVRTESNYLYTAGTDFFNEDFSRYTFNTIISKSLKNDALLFSLAGYDLFNQNGGFERSISENKIMQSTYTNIKRYFLLSLTYKFNKTSK